MSKLGTVAFVGKSGHRYQFAAYPLGVRLKQGFGGVYFITGRTNEPHGPHNHHKIYLGETGDLSELSGGSSNLERFQAEGANCICIHATRDGQARVRILKDLLAHYAPVCNV